jgi:hypothetical protein
VSARKGDDDAKATRGDEGRFDPEPDAVLCRMDRRRDGNGLAGERIAAGDEAVPEVEALVDV